MQPTERIGLVATVSVLLFGGRYAYLRSSSTSDYYAWKQERRGRWYDFVASKLGIEEGHAAN